MWHGSQMSAVFHIVFNSGGYYKLLPGWDVNADNAYYVDLMHF